MECSQKNLISIASELSSRNNNVFIMSDNGILVRNLNDNIKWIEFPFVGLRHPSLKFYLFLQKIIIKNNIDYVIPIDPILGLFTLISYFFHKTPVFPIITAQEIPSAFVSNWPTIFVNKDRMNIYKNLFKTNNSILYKGET